MTQANTLLFWVTVVGLVFTEIWWPRPFRGSASHLCCDVFKAPLISMIQGICLMSNQALLGCSETASSGLLPVQYWPVEFCLGEVTRYGKASDN